MSNDPTQPNMTVPYLGFLGNMSDLPIFDTDAGYPAIINKNHHPQPYTLKRGDRPLIAVKLLVGTAQINFTLLNGNTSAIVGEIPMSDASAPITYVPRNTQDEGNDSFVLEWDGLIQVHGYWTRVYRTVRNLSD
ncbi:hypothetical protein BZG36_04718 [Bifiguratus adelaidae]|uniref:Uncharacterized protein n=1 Tax=Bifiguratus adelaidae TaxID=1938954 RepID=A0A261XV39_9FUNG|nr:hypothetical protein BZG36_04718 [Bifiguratus adelaidae]